MQPVIPFKVFHIRLLPSACGVRGVRLSVYIVYVNVYITIARRQLFASSQHLRAASSTVLDSTRSREVVKLNDAGSPPTRRPHTHTHTPARSAGRSRLRTRVHLGAVRDICGGIALR